MSSEGFTDSNSKPAAENIFWLPQRLKSPPLMKQLIAGPKALRHPKPYFACEIMRYLDSLATRLNRLQKKAIAEERSNLRGLKPSGFWDAYAGLKARSSTVLGNLSLFPKHVKSLFPSM